MTPKNHPRFSLPKSRTGIEGLDEITRGGLPAGRPTLVCGGAGAGKTMLALEFIVRGATQFGEPGVFMMFEENAGELSANARSLGYDLEKLGAQKKIALDYVRIERSEIEETGDYDLEGLFIRLGHSVERIGAKRVVLDTLEALFSGLPNHAVLRAELRRLFRWLKERGLTAVITGERGEHSLTRYGLEEYVADCVITLDNQVEGQISTRRLRVLKYRGSGHGSNEYPFLIGESGISVMPVTSLRLDHEAPAKRIPTGVARLDEMLGGEGFYRGSSVLVSGTAGTGKSSVGAAFVQAACARGERALFFAYEESPAQITRNMRSIGIDLEPWVRKDLLHIHSSRPTLQGLEQHLVTMHDAVRSCRPSVVIVDPITHLTAERNQEQVRPTLTRLIDFMKTRAITALFTSLSHTEAGSEGSDVGVSSLMDTWLLLRNVESNGERNRLLCVLKSRGMAHSNQVREFVLTDEGIRLVETSIGRERALTGTARLAEKERERAGAEQRGGERAGELLRLEAQRKAIEKQLEALRAEQESVETDAKLPGRAPPSGPAAARAAARFDGDGMAEGNGRKSGR